MRVVGRTWGQLECALSLFERTCWTALLLWCVSPLHLDLHFLANLGPRFLSLKASTFVAAAGAIRAVMEGHE
jgi:hypothetical protein